MPPTSLPYRPLGSSGIEVSVVGIGANTFGPPRLDQAQSRQVVDKALDLGVNFVDTAYLYGQGHSEEFLGRALGAHRDRMVIATKYHHRATGEPTASERIIAQAETSLRRLGTDWIDLYQVHVPDPGASAEEVLEALDHLWRSGKVRAIGASNYASWRLAEAESVAGARGFWTFSTVQDYYNVLARDIEREVIPWCLDHRVSVLPYHPLGGGFLTGKYRSGEAPPPGTRGAEGSRIVDLMRSDSNYRALADLESFAADHGHTVGELAVAWLVANPVVASVITGVSTPAQLEANVVGAMWKLTDDEKLEVDRITSPPDGVMWNPERPPYSLAGPG
jgi:aryl-alcohol dehydrogenase-like predicted oxidoreductase